MKGAGSEQTRADRKRTLAHGVAAGLVARVVAVASPLLLVPIALGYVGQEPYAIWTAALSLTAMAVFADLGLGQGLMTLLTPRLVAGEWQDARRLVSSAYSTLLLVSIAALILIAATLSMTEWAGLLGFSPNRLNNSIVIACLSAFILNLPLSLITRVLYAAQEVARANIWQAVGSLLALAGAAVAVTADWGPLAVVVGALTGPLLANAVASADFYLRNSVLRPTPTIPSKSELRELLGLGSGYLVLNLVMAAAINLDVLMISHLSDAAAVVAFGLALRVFSQLGALVSMANAPLWPLNADAIAREDWDWVRSVTRKMTGISFVVASLPSLVLIVAGPVAFDLWAGKELQISRTLLIGAALYWTLIGTLSPRFMVQNSVGVLRPQLLGWTAFLVVSLPLKYVIIAYHSWDWLTLASFAVALITIVPGALWGYRTTIARADGNSG